MVVFAFEQIDELEARVNHDAATTPHLGECPREHVTVMIPFIRGIGAFSMQCVVVHNGGRVRHVEFPDGWEETMRSHGYPVDEEAEQLIEALCWVEFLRGAW